MKIEKALSSYYKDEIKGVDIPPCSIQPAVSSPLRKRLYRAALAAVFALIIFPFSLYPAGSTILAAKAGENLNRSGITEKISSGLMNLHIIASNTFIPEDQK